MNVQKFIEVVTKIGELIKDTTFFNKTYVVGGAVRDYFLMKDIKDIDLVVEMENGGILLGEYLTKKYGSSKIVIFKNYGTCKFNINNIKELKDIEFEAVQTRKEWYTDGNRKPSSIALGSIYDDAIRRDLTINALYMNVNTLDIIDPTNLGKNDIADGIIRVPSNDINQTFIDDPLRMLRVVRFSSKLGFKINKKTYLGIINNTNKIKTISKERITDEINKLLLSDTPSKSINMLQNLCLLDKIFPDVYKLKYVYKNCHVDGNLYDHTMKVLDNSNNCLVSRLAALLHDIGKIKDKYINYYNIVSYPDFEKESANMARNILFNLKYSNKIIDDVCFVILNQLKLTPYGDKCESISNKSIRKLLNLFGNRLFLVLNLIHSDNISYLSVFSKPYAVPNFIKQVEELKDNGEDVTGNIKLPLNGNDIINILNIKSGPIVKFYLDYIKELYLINPNITKEMCEIEIKNKYNKINNKY